MVKRRYWLFKSEPSDYSFNDLMGEDNQTAEWDGVRNYTARNHLRDDVQVGDGVLFYHSNIQPQLLLVLQWLSEIHIQTVLHGM